MSDWLSGDAAIAAVTAAVIAVWYVLWRKIEPYLPDWITRLVLGSAAAPTYAKTTSDGAASVTTMTAATGSITGLPITITDTDEGDADYVIHDLAALDMPEIVNTRTAG
ncbi:hypothetical protein [Cellulomonas denverensis]|uniref:hypothetical protein n=1 Tax=Cellulomonas denverensis TaxID=264297 RepID=UPI0035E79EC7